jgi:Na+-transporting methylmalonyl-CoA/oxaloacetate decarboxylase gamma subunit
LESVLHRAREAAAAERWEDACEILRRARSQPELAASPELIEFLAFCLRSQARVQPEIATSLLAEVLLTDPNNADVRGELEAAKTGRPRPPGITGDWRQFLKVATFATAAFLVLLLIRTMFMVTQTNRRFSEPPEPPPVSTAAPFNQPGQPHPPARSDSVFGFVVLTVLLTAGMSALLLKLTKKAPKPEALNRPFVTGE